MVRAAILLALLAACRPGGESATPSSPTPAPAQSERQTIALDGDPNGLMWDADAGALLIADGDGNRILRWTEADGVKEHVALPGDGSGGRGLGQLVRLADGRLVVTRFGGGESGGIVVIETNGEAKNVAGLDPSRRRIGLALAPSGEVFTAWFEKHGDTRVGTVARIDLAAGTETIVIEGLQKPVGLVVQGDALLVADQRLGQILRAPLSDLAHPQVFVAKIEAPDLLCEGPDGSLLTGGKNGEVRRIAKDGTVTVVAENFSTVRGVAYDPAKHRLFIAEHAGKDDAEAENALHIVPLE